jgi:hypothetical protein
VSVGFATLNVTTLFPLEVVVEPLFVVVDPLPTVTGSVPQMFVGSVVSQTVIDAVPLPPTASTTIPPVLAKPTETTLEFELLEIL